MALLCARASAETVVRVEFRLANVVTQAQTYANAHRVDVLIWKLPLEAHYPQLWTAQTANDPPPRGAMLEQTVKPK